MASGVDDDASGSVECVDGLEILYEEPVAEDLDGVEEEPVQPELTGVEEEPAPEPISVEDETELQPEALEEIELDEITNDEIREP